jgi:rod shape-determining protein MreD
MLQHFLSRLGWFVLLLAFQVLIFNHIHILGYATPLPYVYFLLILSGSTPRWLYITLGFVMGLSVDLFNNTPGMAAAALCACGLVAPRLMAAFAPSDRSDDDFLPSSRTMKWGGFLRYASSLIVLHCALFFTIEAFSLDYWGTLLLDIVSSSVLTLLFVIALEAVRSHRSQQ